MPAVGVYVTGGEFIAFLGRLSNASENNFMDPRTLEWPDVLDVNAWFFTPELVSLHRTPTWEAMDEAARKRLSFFEAVNFFSLNIHGEKYLISEISRFLHTGQDPELSRYLLHFIEEEAKHMMYFATFCGNFGGKVYPDRTLRLDGDRDGEFQRFLLFLRIYLFEEIVDEYNTIMANDERLAPIAREINRIHHFEESRHLAFGRRFIRQQLENWPAEEKEGRLAAARQHLEGYCEMTWKQYYNPDVYRDAGIGNYFETWQSVWKAETSRFHRRSIMRNRLGPLFDLGLLEGAG